MNFVRSRIALVGLLVAWPAAQLAGCAQKDRSYGPVDTGEGGAVGTGGSSKGGTSGKGTGGSSATGGTVGDAGTGDTGSGGTGGKGGSSGATGGTGGKGGSSSGATGGATGGTGDTAGTGDTGGEGGTKPEPDPGCVATGDEVCSDGLDNDCDGTTDCLELTGQFPTPHGAASAADVAYTFAAPADTAVFQCRATRGDTGSGAWHACPRVGDDFTVSPFPVSAATSAAVDGYYTTEVRLRFPSGAISEPFRRNVYVHHSLADVERCPATASDAAYIAAAKPHLTDEGAFDPSTARSPFIQVAFEPPVSVKYQVEDTEGTVNWRSLRRQFTFSSDKHYMVMRRTYSARAGAGMGCYAAIKRVHHVWGSSLSVGPMQYQSCMAIVFNKKGAGYCLDFIGDAVVSAEHLRSDMGAAVPAPAYSPEADNFIWRKLTNPIRPVAGHFMSNFSSKCDDEGCAEADLTGYTLFLPDKQYFSYWP